MMSLVRDFRAVEERWEMFRCVVVSFCQVRASHVGSREVGGGAAGGTCGGVECALSLLYQCCLQDMATSLHEAVGKED